MRKIFLNFGCRSRRISQIVAIETIDDRKTGNNFTCDINPEVVFDEFGSNDSYGLEDAFFKDKPVFKEIVEDFLKYIGDGPIFVFNFCYKDFLFEELKRINYPLLENKFIALKSFCIREASPTGRSYRLFLKGGASYGSNSYDYAFYLKSEELSALSEAHLQVEIWLKFLELRKMAGL